MQWPNFDAQTQNIVEAKFGILRTIKSKQKQSRRCFFFNHVKKLYFYRHMQVFKVSLKVNRPKKQFELIKYHFYTINGRTVEHDDRQYPSCKIDLPLPFASWYKAIRSSIHQPTVSYLLFGYLLTDIIV